MRSSCCLFVSHTWFLKEKNLQIWGQPCMKSTGAHILEPRACIDVNFNLPTPPWRRTPFANKTSKGTQGKKMKREVWSYGMHWHLKHVNPKQTALLRGPLDVVVGGPEIFDSWKDGHGLQVAKPVLWVLLVKPPAVIPNHPGAGRPPPWRRTFPESARPKCQSFIWKKYRAWMCLDLWVPHEYWNARCQITESPQMKRSIFQRSPAAPHCQGSLGIPCFTMLLCERLFLWWQFFCRALGSDQVSGVSPICKLPKATPRMEIIKGSQSKSCFIINPEKNLWVSGNGNSKPDHRILSSRCTGGPDLPPSRLYFDI